MKKLTIILIKFIVLIAVPLLSADDDFVLNENNRNKIRIKLGPSLWGGYTLYRIGYPVEDSTGKYSGHFPFSELKFPTTSFSASMSGEYDISEKINIGLRFDRNISMYTGKMEDSDWIDRTSKLDIYSESDTDMSAYFFDLNGGYTLFRKKNWRINAGGGLIYRYFYFECGDTEQTYPSGDFGSDTDYIDGVTITYQAVFLIPYARGEAGYNISKSIEVVGGIGISPYLVIWDRDEHIARVPPVYAEGEYRGYAGLFSFKAGYRITSRWSITAEYNWMYIKAEGEQKNTQNGSDPWTTAAEVISNQYMLILYAGYSF